MNISGNTSGIPEIANNTAPPRTPTQRLRFWPRAGWILFLIFAGLPVAAHDAGRLQEEQTRRSLESAEHAYLLSATDQTALDQSYEALVHRTRLRLETARKEHLSPEASTVSSHLSPSPAAVVSASPATSAYRYDATLLTIAAGLESQAYERGGKKNWQTASLPLGAADAGDRYYRKDVRAHHRLGDPSGRRLFILLNSSYSTWERGSWTNKTIALLRAQFGDPHLVVFAGFLTPEFLECEPAIPALGGNLPARDLHPRIRGLIEKFIRLGQIPPDPEIALIGFSGGANLTISLLAEDSRRLDAGLQDEPLFKAGGIAFSPILDLPISLDLLDRSSRLLDEQGFPAKRALTTPLLRNALSAAIHKYGPGKPEPLLEMSRIVPEMKTSRNDVIARFYREFEVVDLAATASARYGDSSVRRSVAKENPHRSYYMDVAFPAHRRLVAQAEAQTFENYTRLEPELGAITAAPLYLIFARDDPVLAKSALTPDVEFPPRCEDVLNFARQQPRIRVFSPPHGAHMGYMLDNDFLSAIFSALHR